MTPPAFGPDVWSTESWREEAMDWVDARLSDLGISRIGEDRNPRMWTWSIVMQLPTDHGTAWFKATSPVTAHEIRLYPVLERTVPDLTLRPLASDLHRDWLLLPDGGTTLKHASPHDELFSRLEGILPQYARLQISLMPEAKNLLKLGVPDMRPNVMAARFDEAFDVAQRVVQHHPEDGDRDLLERIAEHRPAFAAISDRLAQSRIPVTLDHGDLHANNILPSTVGTPRFFDWGDSMITHPFSSMLVLERFTASLLGITSNDHRFQRLREAYLSEFDDFGSYAALNGELEAACHSALVSRALTFANVLALGPLPDPSWNREPLRWMASLVDQRGPG